MRTFLFKKKKIKENCDPRAKKLGEGNENWASPPENWEGCNVGMQCLHLLYPKAINQEALVCVSICSLKRLVVICCVIKLPSCKTAHYMRHTS